jgi:hypothetical protein
MEFHEAFFLMGFSHYHSRLSIVPAHAHLTVYGRPKIESSVPIPRSSTGHDPGQGRDSMLAHVLEKTVLVPSSGSS